MVLEGEWRFGYFAMVAVGATNVGSISIDWEPELVTNKTGQAQLDITVTTWQLMMQVWDHVMTG